MFSQFFIQDGSAVGSVLPAVHGGSHGEAGGGLVGLLDRLLETLAGGGGPEAGSSWNLFGGIGALGSNVHPLIVHFPIAFLTAFLLLEVSGLALRKPAVRQVASGMLYLGALSAVAAAGAGLVAEASVPHGAAVHEIMEWHERAGLTVATLSVILALWRYLAHARFSSMAQALHLFVAGLIAVCLVFGADLGGLMVYQYGVGVKGLQEAEAVHHHHHHEEPDDQSASDGHGEHRPPANP
jgi:uncharacterized membrane protein